MLFSDWENAAATEADTEPDSQLWRLHALSPSLLTAQQRRVMILIYKHELSTTAAASVLGIRQPAVVMHRKAALLRLRNEARRRDILNRRYNSEL